MIAVEQNVFHSFLTKHDEKQWAEVMTRLMPSIHPVDQIATRIWFSFWPLRLARELQESTDVAQTVKRLQLDGNFRLEEQVDASIEYFLGSRFWGGVKNAILHHAESMTRSAGAGLEEQIRGIADKVAQDKSIELRFVLGITAVGVMMFQQIGIAAFADAAVRSYEIKNHHSPEELIKLRQGKPAGWRMLFGAKKHRVTFDEGHQDGSFQALEGQDLSMASSCDKRDFRSQDHRRIAGPVPAECRSGACGYCWIGVLGGQQNLSDVTEFEKKRLHHFGYVPREVEIRSHSHIRLACQSKCYGDMSVVIPPWNGVLDGGK
jgi:ferredoxin